MNYQSLLDLVSNLATATCVCSSFIAREHSAVGNKICAIGALAAIVSNALELYYAFSFTNILLIFLLGVILLLVGYNLGRTPAKKKESQKEANQHPK